MNKAVIARVSSKGHFAKGLLIDTNILLLWLVGNIARDLIPRFKKTCVYSEEDFDLLVELLGKFKRILTTPNILSEVSNLGWQLTGGTREQFAAVLQVLAKNSKTKEKYIRSLEVVDEPHFPWAGLTDSNIIQLARRGLLVLTDDAALHAAIVKEGGAVINFNHLRFSEFQ